MKTPMCIRPTRAIHRRTQLGHILTDKHGLHTDITWTYTNIQIQTDRHTDRRTDTYTDERTDPHVLHTDRHSLDIYRQTDTYTDGQTDPQVLHTDRQTDT